MKKWLHAYREETGERYQSRYRRGSKGTAEGKRRRDRGYHSRRRQILRDVSVAEVEPLEIFERDDWVCGICGGPVDQNAKSPDPRSPCVDHVIPLVAGGEHAPWNVQCAHFLCNSIKAKDDVKLV